MEAFEALRASVRMLGVRKSGLGVRIALLEKESMMALYWLSFLNCRVPARVTLLLAPGGQKKKAWWERGRREDDETKQGNSECARLAGEFKIQGLLV